MYISINVVKKYLYKKNVRSYQPVHLNAVYNKIFLYVFVKIYLKLVRVHNYSLY